MTRIIVCLISLLWASTAWAAAPQPIETLRLTPVNKRITDEAIAADMHVFKEAQARIAALNTEGIPLTNYYLAKAQAWVELAEEEYTENDRGAIIEVALQQALYLIEELEAKATDISLETPVLDPQTRPDLWHKAEAWKAQGSGCVDSATAELEVQLVRVDHEHAELGFLHAKPYILKAERLIAQMSEQRNPFCRASLTQAVPPAAMKQADQPALAEPMEQPPIIVVIPPVDAFPPSGIADEAPGPVPPASDSQPADLAGRTPRLNDDSAPMSTHDAEAASVTAPVSPAMESVESIPAVPGPVEALTPESSSLDSDAKAMDTPSDSLQTSQDTSMPADSNPAPPVAPDAGAPPQDLDVFAALDAAVTLLQERPDQNESLPEIIAGSIHFATNRSRINPIAARLLDHVAAVLRANPDIQIQLDGHADRRGPHSYNIRLGQERAEAAERYLLQAGVSAERLTVRSFGKRKPLTSGHTRKQLAQNRRVNIIITESPGITSRPQEDDLQIDTGKRHRTQARIATR